MSSLKQYIDLFSQERATLCSNAPELLNAARDRAKELLDAAGRFPVKTDEGYEKTSVEDMFASDLGVNINRVNIPVNVADSFRCDVPNITTLMAVVVNDRFVPTATLQKNLPEGVTVCSLRDADPELVGRWLGKVVENNDIALAFNSLLLQDGVLIHVAKGVKLEKALQIVNIFSGQTPMFAPRRVLLVAEEGAEVSVLKCDHTQTADVQFGASEIVEIYAGENAHIDWYDLEESTPSTVRWCQFRCRQEAHSSLNICGATLTNGSTRNEFQIEIAGDGCDTQLSGMAIGSGSQHIDNNSFLRHSSARSNSNQLFKYVLDDEATGAFEGCIEVAHGARFNEAYQSNCNLLASDKARMHTKPQLLIYNDDVKCSHGASTGQLDSAALFYMQSRGIPMAEARKMLMQAFMVDVVEKIRLENLRDRLRHLLEMRFSGACGDSACSGCRK
jgi:Fe-S cluster assembly protein SufD